MRNKLLDGETVEQSKIIEIAGHNIDRFLADNRGVSQAQLNRYILDNISYRLDDRGKEIASKKREEVKAYLLDRTREALHEQEERLNNDDKMSEFMRLSLSRSSRFVTAMMRGDWLFIPVGAYVPALHISSMSSRGTGCEVYFFTLREPR